MKIFIQAVDRLRTPTSSEAGLLSCLKIIQTFIRATQSGEPDKLTIVPVQGVHVDLQGMHLFEYNVNSNNVSFNLKT